MTARRKPKTRPRDSTQQALVVLSQGWPELQARVERLWNALGPAEYADPLTAFDQLTAILEMLKGKWSQERGQADDDLQAALKQRRDDLYARMSYWDRELADIQEDIRRREATAS